MARKVALQMSKDGGASASSQARIGFETLNTLGQHLRHTSQRMRACTHMWMCVLDIHMHVHTQELLKLKDTIVSQSVIQLVSQIVRESCRESVSY